MAMERSSPFKEAKVARHGRRHAEATIEAALLVFEARQPSEAELADLADALDALTSGQFRVAIVLAEAAVGGRSRLRTAIRPPTMARSLAALKSFAAALAQRGAAGHHQDF
jgi:hypothetical protein